MATAKDVLGYWLDVVGPDGWYLAVPRVDEEIRAKFLPLWETAAAGGLLDWLDTPEGLLAFIIVTDQFSRNMFRGDGRSFATDSAARQAARRAVAQGADLAVKEPERVFFYMPFEHSEEVADQEWSVALMAARLPETGKEFAIHARAHREIILRFGRFPFRNSALGRTMTDKEHQFLDSGGYTALVRELAN